MRRGPFKEHTIMDQETYRNLYKDAFGVTPVAPMTQASWAFLVEANDHARQERDTLITTIIGVGAHDRATAERWLRDA